MNILIKLHVDSTGKLLDWNMIGNSEQYNYISEILNKCIG